MHVYRSNDQRRDYSSQEKLRDINCQTDTETKWTSSKRLFVHVESGAVKKTRWPAELSDSWWWLMLLLLLLQMNGVWCWTTCHDTPNMTPHLASTHTTQTSRWDFDARASTWMVSPCQRPVVTLTFDLQNLIRSRVGLVVIPCKCQAVHEISW